MLQLFVALLSIGLLSARAGASDIDLSWVSPAQDCPGREQVQSALAQRLQREIRFGADAPIRLSGVVAREAAGYALSLTIDSEHGSERRILRAVGCNELASAMVLIAALRFTEAAERSAAPRASPAPARVDAAPAPAEVESSSIPTGVPERRKLYLRAQLVGDLGTFPSPALGPSVMLGIALAGLQLELGGTYLLSQDVSIAGRDAAVGLLQLTTADAAVCYRVLRRPFVAPCLLGELGRLAAKGLNLPQFEDRTLLWLAVGASARLGVDIARWLRWQTEIAAALPWDHAHFGVRDLGSVHRIPAVIGRLSVGLEGSF